MNKEQVEAQLSEYERKVVAVNIPIRGTILLTYYGELIIVADWVNHMIMYVVRFYPDMSIAFQASDVQKIISTETEALAATIILNSDAPMHQSSIR
jgi:hypothetical protein